DISGKIFLNNFDCPRVRFWIGPGVVGAEIFALADIVILAFALPWAGVGSGAFLQVVMVYSRRREIPVAFYVNQLALVRLCNDLVSPDCFHDYTPSLPIYCSIGEARQGHLLL